MPFCADLFYRFYDGGSSRYVYPVILLHGAGSTHLGWPVDLRRLPGLRVFAVDLPGHGKSKGPSYRSMDSLTDQLHIFIREMGFFYVVLAGHSLGAALALTYTSRFPERIKGLMVISCGTYFKIPQNLLDSLRKPAKKEKAVEILKRSAFYEKFPEATRREILKPLHDLRASTLEADLSICDRFYFDGIQSNLQCRVLICGGKEDTFAPPISLRQLQILLPGSTLNIYDKAGHMLVFKKIDTLFRTAKNYLATSASPF